MLTETKFVSVKIELDGSIPALKPCKKCGSVEAFLGPGSGPHGPMVKCGGCYTFLGWLPKRHSKASEVPSCS